MNKLQFHEESAGYEVSRKRHWQSESLLTRLIKKATFGLIQTKRQVQVAQVIFLLISVLYIVFMLGGGDESTYQAPSDELINSPQPINP